MSSVSVSPPNWERSLLATRYIKHKRCDALDLHLLEFIIKLFFVTENLNILTKFNDSLAYCRASFHPMSRPPFAAIANAPNRHFE